MKFNKKKIICTIFLSMFILSDLGGHFNQISSNNELTFNFKNYDPILKTVKNQNAICNNITDFSSKIDKNLVQSLQIDPNSIDEFQINKIRLIIIFEENYSKIERLKLIENYDPNCQIFYNYDIIPAISVEMNRNKLNLLIISVDDIEEISYIGMVHQKNLVQNNFLDTSVIEDNSNWDSSFSFDNWWLDAIGANNISYTGKGINLAIMDTGISVHPDFYEYANQESSRIVQAKNFAIEDGNNDPQNLYDDFGHGTHCAGIAGGNGYISDGIYRGVAPDVNLFNAKVSNSSGMIDEDDVIAAIEWCLEMDVDIISMSFSTSVDPTLNAENLAIMEAIRQGVIVLSSAGNSGPSFFSVGTPASLISTISVGATDINGHIASFSSYGPSYSYNLLPDICAPGVNIISTESFNSYLALSSSFRDEEILNTDEFAYISLSGTSMSCPMVAGAVALLLEPYPDATPESIRNALIMGASPIESVSSQGYGNGQGAGLLNIPKSLQYLNNISETRTNVNDQVKILPREIPFAPFDLIKFPGDHQFLNLTISSGSMKSIKIELPQLDGITFNFSNESQILEHHTSSSFNLRISIDLNATYGNRFGFLLLKDSSSNEILDAIPISIEVMYPKGIIYLDSFHGLNDYSAENFLSFPQIDLYYAIHDLYALNYKVYYNMENWTENYNVKDAQILNPELLSNIDILVLQTPVLPYSDFEIQSILDFYNAGGSILFLGTKSEAICVNSINKLFDYLGIGININQTNIFDVQDYGIIAQYRAKIIEEINYLDIIGEDVNNFVFNYGNTFSVSNNAYNLSSYENKIVAAGFDGSIEGKGRVITFGDYHFLSNSIYNSPDYYENHHNLMEDLISYLDINPIQKISIIKFENNLENQHNVDILINCFNYSENLPINSLIDGHNLNLSIIHNNYSQEYLSINEINDFGQYFSSFMLSESDYSSKPLSIVLNFSYGGVFKQFKNNYYFYPTEFNSYEDITLPDSEIFRDMTKIYNFTINSTNNNINFTSFIAVDPITLFNENSMDEIITKATYNASSQNEAIISINGAELKSSGTGIMYCFANNSENYIDFFPNRIKFAIINSIPSLNLTESRIGEGSLFSYPVIQAEFRNSYPLELFVSDYENNDSELNVFCSFIPIIVYDSYFQFMLPENIPNYEIIYDLQSKSFKSNIVFPNVLNFSKFDNTTMKSLETDFLTKFGLLWITIRDKDGGSYNYYIICLLFENIPDTQNYFPLVFIFGLIIGGCFFLNFTSKKKIHPESYK